MTRREAFGKVSPYIRGLFAGLVNPDVLRSGELLTLQQELDVLQPRSYPVLLVEISCSDRGKGKAKINTNRDPAVRVSVELQKHIRKRPTSTILFRRFADPNEFFLGDVPELKWVTESLLQLCAPFGVNSPGNQSIKDQIAFAQTLSPAHQRRMVNGGLSVGELSGDQQRLWNRVNSYRAFGTSLRQLRVARDIMKGWQDSELVYLNRPTRDSDGAYAVNRNLWWRYPNSDPADRDHKGLISVPQSVSRKSSNWVQGAVDPSVETLRDRDLQVDKIPAAKIPDRTGVVSIKELCVDISQMLKFKVSIPSYLARRRIFVRLTSGSVRSVLCAVEDLTSHTWQRGKEGALELMHPTVRSARTVPELREAMLRVLPLPFSLLWNEEGQEAGATRRILQYLAFRGEVDSQHGKDWERILATRLGYENTQRWAGWLIQPQLRHPLEYLALRSEPLAWVAAPERGFFTLSGEILPGQHPLLEFHAPRSDGKVDAWGWFVGTSSLD